MAQIVTGNAFIERLCTALGIDPDKTSRIVLDIRAGEAIHVYVEQYGDIALEDMDIPALDVEPVMIKVTC